MVRCMILFFLCISFSAKSDKEAPAKPFIITQDNLFETFYFKMIPEKSHYENGKLIVEKEAWGKAFRLNDDGSDTELWSVYGWYSHQIFLAGESANNLVRIGNWSRGSEPEPDDLAIAFYQDGKLVKSYSTNDLIKDKTKVDVSVSHYRWLDSHKMSWFKDHFTVKTLEGFTYKFNISSGEIVELTLPNNTP